MYRSCLFVSSFSCLCGLMTHGDVSMVCIPQNSCIIGLFELILPAGDRRFKLPASPVNHADHRGRREVECSVFGGAENRRMFSRRAECSTSLAFAGSSALPISTAIQSATAAVKTDHDKRPRWPATVGTSASCFVDFRETLSPVFFSFLLPLISVDTFFARYGSIA